MDGGAWQAAVHGVAKSQTRLSDFIFTFHFHALEEGMATHSSVLAWRIPGTGEPGGMPYWGRTESDTTEVTQQQQQQTVHLNMVKITCLTQLSDFTFTFHFFVLEKDMATHSSVLAWKIPGTREPGGLPSMG